MSKFDDLTDSLRESASVRQSSIGRLDDLMDSLRVHFGSSIAPRAINDLTDSRSESASVRQPTVGRLDDLTDSQSESASVRQSSIGRLDDRGDRPSRFPDEAKHRPCGDVHALPCGLDQDCEVPPSYFSPNLSSESIWEAYQNDEQ